MKSRLKLAVFICVCLLSRQTFALTEYDADSIVNIMKRVAKYRMTYSDIANLFNHTSAGKGDQPNPYNGTNQGNDWDVGSFMTGLMAMYYTSQDTAYLNFAKRWAIYFNWLPWNGINTTSADNMCCTQTYSEIYLTNPVAANNVMIASTKSCLTHYFDVVKPNPPYSRTNGWWWCDALYMAPPAVARYVKASNENRFLDSLDRYWWSVTKYLYDTTYHFYYRDDGFFPTVQKCPNGKPMFWSCGVAWAIGGLARVLDYMPATYANRPKWVAQFKDMCAAIKAEQGFNNTSFDGLWTTSMLDHPDFPFPETSGSAFFCFAMAWGVRNGLLDSATYTPAINKAWRDLVKNIGTDGRLKLCQHVDWMPRSDLSGDVNNSSPEGEGAFLQAGYEMYLKATGTTNVASEVKKIINRRQGFSITRTGFVLEPTTATHSSFKIYSSSGRLVADLSARLHTLGLGVSFVPFSMAGLASGIYTAEYSTDKIKTVKSIISY